MDEWIGKIRTFISREKKKKKKKRRKETKNNRPSLSLSLFPSLSPLRFSAHDTRGKRAGGLSDIREYSIPVHDTSRRGNFFPRWAAVHREEAARSGFWVDERGYAARWGRLVTDSLSPGVATPTPPLRHPTPFPATPSTHRPLRGSTPLLLSHVLCTRAYRQTLSLFPPPPVSVSLERAPERSRTQGWWPAVTHPSAGCHSIYSLEDRERGRRGWWNSGRMGALGKMRTGDI